LRSDARQGRVVCEKGQLQVVEDAVDYGIIGDEGDDAHLSLAPGADKRGNFIEFTDHLCPAPQGDPRALLLDAYQLVGHLL